MQIRKLSICDYQQFYSLVNDFRPTKFTQDQFINLVDNLTEKHQIWVIEDGSILLATGTIIIEQKFIHNLAKLGHIEDICVRQEFRSNGLGKKMIHHLMKIAKDNDCYKITLACNLDNVTFYEKCGLEKRGVQMSQLCS